MLATLAADNGVRARGRPGDGAGGRFQAAFTGAAILMLVGVVLLAALVRRSDVANVSPDATGPA